MDGKEKGNLANGPHGHSPGHNLISQFSVLIFTICFLFFPNFAHTQDGLTEIISKLDEIKEENRSELVDILDSYFDPEKEQIVPVSKKQNRRQRSFKRGTNGHGSNKENRRSLNGAKNASIAKRTMERNNNNDELDPHTPDSTTASPQRRHRRFRKRGTNNNRQLTPIKKTESNGNTTTTSNTVGATDLTKVKAVDTGKLGYITVA